MNKLRKSPQIASSISLALILLCLCVPTMRFGKVHAQDGHKSPQAQRLEREDDSIDISQYLSPDLTRVSPDLREQLDRQSSSGDFRTLDAKGGTVAGPAGGNGGGPAKDQVVRAIVQLKQQPGNGLSAFLGAASVVERG